MSGVEEIDDGSMRARQNGRDSWVGVRVARPAESHEVPAQGAWCEHPGLADASSSSGAPIDRIGLSRWRNAASSPHQATALVASDAVLIIVNLQPTRNIRRANGVAIHRGALGRGDVWIVGPGTSLESTWDMPSDELHLHCPVSTLCAFERGDDALRLLLESAHSQSVVARERAVVALADSLSPADLECSPLVQSFQRAIATAMVSIVIHQLHSKVSASHRRPMARSSAHEPVVSSPMLPAWRLERVFNYVENHLHERVSLPDLAQASGLSRMHFAALFRAATGLSPAEYVLDRRIARACEGLLDAGNAIVDVALACGFSTQSHFTTVFKRKHGITPNVWRARQLRTMG